VAAIVIDHCFANAACCARELDCCGTRRRWEGDDIMAGTKPMLTGWKS
jgi:hypothetical protein